MIDWLNGRWPCVVARLPFGNPPLVDRNYFERGNNVKAATTTKPIRLFVDNPQRPWSATKISSTFDRKKSLDLAGPVWTQISLPNMVPLENYGIRLIECVCLFFPIGHVETYASAPMNVWHMCFFILTGCCMSRWHAQHADCSCSTQTNCLYSRFFFRLCVPPACSIFTC